MTCAETRRQLPEPDPAHLQAVSDHVAICPPCRVEQEDLREIDRRVHQLGQHRLAAAQKMLQAEPTAPDVAPTRAVLDHRGYRELVPPIGFALALFLALLAFFHFK